MTLLRDCIPAPAVQQGLLSRHGQATEYTPGRPPPFDDWPAVYALRCFGDCCAPEIEDGSSVIVDRAASYERGDFVVVWHLAPNGRIVASVKRLALNLAPWATLPYKLNGGNVSPVVLCERLNPPALVAFDACEVYGLHRCIGVAAPRPEVTIGTNVPSDSIRWFEAPANAVKPQKRRRSAPGGVHV